MLLCAQQDKIEIAFNDDGDAIMAAEGMARR